MKLHIEMDFKYIKEVEREGRKVKERAKETRVWDRDLDELPLVLLEVGETESIAEMRQGVVDFLDLTPEEARQVTLGHIKQITGAIEAAQQSPNA